MRGNSAWDPWTVVQAGHPDVQVISTKKLPGQLQGCVDHQRRIIWLTKGLTEVQARCTLAYELAQLRQGPTPSDPCLAAAHRRAAEEWAALMLINADDLLSAICCSENLAGMAAVLGVDTPTVRARFRSLTDREQDQVFLAQRRRLSDA